MKRNQPGRRLALLLAPVLLAGALSSAPALAASGAAAYKYTPGPVQPFVSLDQVKQGWTATEAKLLPPRVTVRGIYLTSYSAANPAKLNELIGLAERTEINAMVVNVKDDWGNITFNMTHPIATPAGAVSPDIKDVRAFTDLLRSKNIYSIARVVSFKDANVPKYRPDLAVANKGGGIWRDYNGVTWLNPYSHAAWDYLVDIGKAAALGGFDEVQFDYVRFPTDGNLDAIEYPGKDGRQKQQAIADFLAYARKELRPYQVRVSADVFGLVTSAGDDMGIGQHLEELSTAVDYISPMVYPSHYTDGNLGVAHPNAMPYDTVFRSMKDARERVEKVGQQGNVTMRPWLQDFSWGYPYGAKEVRAQIQATYDAGYKEWLLWNAANEYTEAALEPKTKH
ncbi:MAG TPA: putative glycoside hydrolase [Symbiobacteriaceae bacterium]|nr:putative glycoside hydrolase [Symbiobacteriaceae bacterium]